MDCVDCLKEGRGRVVAHYRNPNLCYTCRQKRKGIKPINEVDLDIETTEIDEVEDNFETIELGGTKVSDDVQNVELEYLKNKCIVIPQDLVASGVFSEIQFIDLGFEKVKAGWVKKGSCATENCLEERHGLDCTGYCKKCKIDKGTIVATRFTTNSRAQKIDFINDEVSSELREDGICGLPVDEEKIGHESAEPYCNRPNDGRHTLHVFDYNIKMPDWYVYNQPKHPALPQGNKEDLLAEKTKAKYDDADGGVEYLKRLADNTLKAKQLLKENKNTSQILRLVPELSRGQIYRIRREYNRESGLSDNPNIQTNPGAYKAVERAITNSTNNNGNSLKSSYEKVLEDLYRERDSLDKLIELMSRRLEATNVSQNVS